MFFLLRKLAFNEVLKSEIYEHRNNLKTHKEKSNNRDVKLI